MRSLGLVEEKVAEAEFFLQEIARSWQELFRVRFAVSAFVGSARSVTFALQASLCDLERFQNWYEEAQERLRRDPIACFFKEFRTLNQHVGLNLVSSGEFPLGRPPRWYFSSTPEIPNVPDDDVETASRRYFVTLLEIVLRLLSPLRSRHFRKAAIHR